MYWLGGENLLFKERPSTQRTDINLFELQTAKPKKWYILFDIRRIGVYEFRTHFGHADIIEVS